MSPAIEIDPLEALRLKALSRELGCSYKTLRNYAVDGVENGYTGDRIHLPTLRDAGGKMVSTPQAYSWFIKALNERHPTKASETA